MRPSACGDGQRFKHISPHLASPRKITHPNLPKGKDQVTQNTDISPHLASPGGEGQIPLAA